MAVQVIRKIASSLGKLFFSQVEPVSKLIVESLMRDKYSSAIRKESTKMLNTLLMCTNDSEQMKVLINLYLPALGMQINTRLATPQGPDFRSVKWLMQETARCFNHFYNYKGAFLTEEMTVNLVGLMGKVLEQVTIDKEQRIAQFQTYKKKMTEEEVEEFEENVQKIDKCWTYVMEIASVLLRNMSEVASPEVLKRLVPKYAKILQEEDRKDYEVVPALCFLDDCIEFGNDMLYQTVSGQAASKLLEVLEKRGPNE